jgi:tripartite-type tricarboxylate transporter receptor subunit TctC
MKLPRREFLHLAVAAAALPAVSCRAGAQAYPSRPVRIIVGFAAAGFGDVIARLMGQWLQERVGQAFVIENRPGAGGNMATELVARAPPDGYALIWTQSSNAINASLYDRLNFSFIRDIAPVAGVVRSPLLMLVNPSFPARTVPEFIAYAKANPGKVNMASPGVGTAPHVTGELFKAMAGVDLVHVPYRGNPMPDLLAGQVQLYFNAMASSMEFVRAGELRVLAVTTATRSELLPDVPALGEFVPGYEASAWQGLGAPRNTPAEIVGKLNQEINVVLADPNVKTRFAGLGAMPMPMTPAEFGRLIADETEKWGKVVRAANIKLD